MRSTKLLLIAGLALPSVAAAQLPVTFNPRSLALGGAYSSLARGWEAALINPAMLGSEGNPSFTIGLPTVNVETGSNTYSFSDFRTYANKTLTDADKAYLLQRVQRNGDSALTLRTIAGAAPFGLSIGPVAIASYTTGSADLSMGADAVQLALYGNASRSGPGQFFTAHGSGGTGWAASVLAASIGLPIAHLPLGRLAAGVTFKKVLGHALGAAGELSSHFQVNPAFTVNAAGQALYTNEGQHCGKMAFSLSASADPCSLNSGSGYGVDIGAVLQMNGRGTTLSAVLTNALGSMTWNANRLVYGRTLDTVMTLPNGSVHDTTISHELYGAAITGDPIARAMRDSVLKQAVFAKVLRVGAAFRKGMGTLTFGGSLRLKQGLDYQPAQSISAGGELRLLKILPLRAGVSTDLGHTLVLSGGSGIQLLGVNLDASIAAILGSVRPGVIVGVGASLIW